MTYNNLEKSLSNLKLISEARAIREENNRLRQTIYEERNASATEIAKLQTQLSFRDMEIQKLRSYKIVYNKNEYSRNKFNTLVKQHVKKEYKEQIQKDVEQKFQKELPSLISSEIKKYPDKCSAATYSLIEAQAIKQRDEFLSQQSAWPNWFSEQVNQIVNSKVTIQMNQEFNIRVLSSAQKSLEMLRKDAWPRYIDDVVTPYLQNTITSQLLTLNTTIQIVCHSCGGFMSVTITPIEISHLLRSGMIQTACIYCKGFFRPRIKITLGSLIWTILNGNSGEPRARIVGKYSVGFQKARGK